MLETEEMRNKNLVQFLSANKTKIIIRNHMCVSLVVQYIPRKITKKTNGVYVQVNGNKSKTDTKKTYSYIINTDRLRMRERERAKRMARKIHLKRIYYRRNASEWK